MLKCLNNIHKIDAKSPKLASLLDVFQKECRLYIYYRLNTFTSDIAIKSKMSSSATELVDDLIQNLTFVTSG